jgi:hypothetical protein
MAGMQPTLNPDGMWTYPNSTEVLKMEGLKSIDHYIGVCIVTITRFIVDQPLFALCPEGERRRGSACCIYWWEQPLNLDNPETLLGYNKDDGDNT